MYLLYKFLLTIVHVIYSFIETFMILWCFVRKKYEILWNKSDIPDDLYYITNCVKSLKNIPSHLAFILVNEDVISIEDLSKLVMWSLAAGISFLTFYDQEGKLKKLEHKLIAEVGKKKDTLDNIAWGPSPPLVTNGKACNSTTDGLKNGCKVKAYQRMRVVLLSHADGAPMLAKAAKLVAHQGLSPVPGSSLSVENLDKILNLVYQEEGWSIGLNGEVFPEPELAIWCGSLACNAGFLPWHIRITEFLQLPNHRDVTPQEFISLLKRYSKCEQRLGK